MGIPPCEFNFSEDFVKRMLESQCPQYASQNVSKFSSGWDNEMYRLGDQYIARFPRREKASQLILNEQKWLPFLKNLLDEKEGIILPVPIFIGSPENKYIWNWSVIKYIEGNTADQVKPDSSQIRTFVHFLKCLHQPAPSEAPENIFRGVPLATREIDILPMIKRIESETNYYTHNIRAIWERAKKAKISKDKKWIHGDLHPLNVLVNNGEIVSVIDWGDMTCGDPATDLVSIWMLFEKQKDRMLFNKAYGLDKNMLARAKGWAVYFAVVMLDTGLGDNEQYAKIGIDTLERLEEDCEL